MKNFYKTIITIILIIFPVNLLNANEKTGFINVDYVIQNSNIGKIALNNIQTLNKKNINQLEKKNRNLAELEKNIKNKKNIISDADFNNEVQAFQKKIKDFTMEKNQIVKDFNKFRKQELDKIFKLFSPIITNYMKENSINMLIDSKNVFIGNANANLTEEILKKINDELK